MVRISAFKITDVTAESGNAKIDDLLRCNNNKLILPGKRKLLGIFRLAILVIALSVATGILTKLHCFKSQLIAHSTQQVASNSAFPMTARMHSEVQESLFENHRDLLPLLSPSLEPDFGDLRLNIPLFSSEFQRVITYNEEKAAAEHRSATLRNMDAKNSSDYDTAYEDLELHAKECLRPAWSYAYKPTCNMFHEMDDLQDPRALIKYLGHGAWREAWLLRGMSESNFVLKHLRYYQDNDARHMDSIFAEAIVLEGLSHSAFTTNLYGHCSTSLAVEPASRLMGTIVPHTKLQNELGHMSGRISQNELDDLSKNDVFSFNDLSVDEKLDIAISMASAVAEMHGYEGGVIANGKTESKAQHCKIPMISTIILCYAQSTSL